VAFFPGVVEHSVVSPVAKVTYYDSISTQGNEGTIILLHGTGGSAENNFRALFPMLAMRYRVVTLDFVDPPVTSDSLDLHHYVEQAVAVIDSATLAHPTTLVGYSFGAPIAAQLAADRPDLVDRLVLVAGWIRTDVHQTLRNDIWTSLYRSKHESLARFMLLTAYSPAYLLARTPAEFDGLLNGLATGPDRAVKMDLNRRVDVTDALVRIDADTLVVGCTEDLMVPIHHSRMLFGAIARARYAEISSGHAVVHERPAQLAQLIQRFIDDPDGIPVGGVITSDHA
jgi:pimeloyl-ACP methyl ester carboxylesterase